MSESNPFRPTRFEHHSNPLIWISPIASRVIEDNGNFYLKGGRGSGKTSVLKSLFWKERLKNDTLQSQIKSEDWSKLGVYIRFPDYISQSLGKIKWEKILPDAPDKELVAFSYFSILIEAIICASIFTAVDTLRKAQKYDYSYENEFQCVRNIVEKVFGKEKYSELNTIKNLASHFEAMHLSMNIAATRGGVKELLNTLPIQPEGKILEHVGEEIRNLVSIDKLYRDKFHIKILLDDAESLQPNQQIHLNSIVRTSKSPIYWVVSYVRGDFDSTETRINNQDLTDADRIVLDLEDENLIDFERFFESVCSLRIYSKLSDSTKITLSGVNPKTIFSLKKTLGTYSVNALIEKVLENKKSRRALQFIENVHIFRNQMKKHKLAEAQRVILGKTGELPPPYYQYYLITKLFPGRDAIKHVPSRLSDFKIFDSTMRRKQVGAYLNVCSEFSSERVFYAGSSIVMHLSDNCIRDYLELMANIYDSYTTKSDKKMLHFTRSQFGPKQSHTPINTKFQNIGIYRASAQKYHGITDEKMSAYNFPKEISNFIAGLGSLTHIMQSDHNDLQSLRTTERGYFLFDLTLIPSSSKLTKAENIELVNRVIKRAQLDGLIKPKLVDSVSDTGVAYSGYEKPLSKLCFRLHNRFAPFFKYSYRGSYEVVNIDMADVVELCSVDEKFDLEQWIEKSKAKLSEATQEQLELFGGNIP